MWTQDIPLSIVVDLNLLHTWEQCNKVNLHEHNVKQVCSTLLALGAHVLKGYGSRCCLSVAGFSRARAYTAHFRVSARVRASVP